jgi:uncharacterized NAD-dependent epimerase/dehydratase family protein
MNLRNEFDAPAPAIVLAEGEFGEVGGKTANGVVAHGEVFDPRVVVDTATAGRSARDVLDSPDAPDVPIVESVTAALKTAPAAEALVVGVAPAGGALPEAWEADIAGAIRAGCDVVSGLHVFLSEQERWQDLAAAHGARLFDVRKPPVAADLRVGDGSVDEVDTDVVLVLGTDCAVGKRTTTVALYRTARANGIDVGWVATGQTGIMIGAHDGIVVDRVPADFAAGAVEDMVARVATDHELVLVEGQASLTHRAYSGVTLSILHGSWPDAVVLADEPGRERRAHFESFPVAGVDSEVGLIEDLSAAEVAALSTWGDPQRERDRHGLPAADIYAEDGPEQLLAAIEDVLGARGDR